MADLVHALEKNGHTYRSDGSIYFRIASFPAYGKLARLDQEGIKPGARVDSDNYAKDDARDFVLWKATKPGEPTWDYGLGPGRPGWHLECSAMALRLLGEPPIDLHAGGIDLIFPHHENEIAQSEGATGTPFSRFWVHVEHLIIDNEKMSKSLGNVYNVQDVVDQGFRPSALRYLLLSSHYRKQLRFSWDTMQQADESLRRLVDFLARLETVTGGEPHPAIAEALARGARRVRRSAAGRPEHVGRPGGAVRPGARAQHGHRRGPLGEADARRARELFAHFDRVLGVLVAAAAGRRPAAGGPGGDRAADRGAPGGPPPPRLRRRRSDPRRPRRPRHHPRGWARRDEVEEEGRGRTKDAWHDGRADYSRRRCPARRPQS